MTSSTYIARRWPNSPPFQDIALRWCEDQSRLLLELLWRGYDRLVEQSLNAIALAASDEAKEESLNFLLCLQIDYCTTGDEPFSVVHQPPEQTKRKHGRGRSPQPDIGFTLYDDPRVIWPVEGKILRDDKDVGPYITEVRKNFVSCRYATFSSEGAMLGYLLHGDTEQTFAAIETALEQALTVHPHFLDRAQRITHHQRADVPHLNSPSDFVCHHLLLSIPTAVN